MSDPSPEKIRQRTEQLEAFVRWLVEVFRDRKQRVTRLLVIDAVILVAANPLVVSLALNVVTKSGLPPVYTLIWGLTVGVLFVIALVVGWVTFPRKREPIVFKERWAIKGLRPFEAADSKLFGQMQRQKMLQECLEAVTSSDFRLGVLSGESGCGKTSFLQAGLVSGPSHA